MSRQVGSRKSEVGSQNQGVRIDSNQAWELLVRQEVAVLATVSDDGRPHVVPFVFAADTKHERLISAVDAKPKSTRELRRIRNIRSRPKVAVLAHHYDEDWNELWWVRADGRASVSDRRPPDAGVLIDKYPVYGDHDLGPWIVIEIESVTGWSA